MKKSFWQVQDPVEPKVVRVLTSTCPRCDCCVSVKTEMTTAAGYSTWYDKEGRLNINNPNESTHSVCCRKCWRGGTVKFFPNVPGDQSVAFFEE